MSVCLSHAGIMSKLAKRIIKLFAPSGSHTILVFFVPNAMAIFRQRLLMEVSNAVGYEKYEKDRDFRPVSRFILKMTQNRVIVIMERQ